VRSSIVDLRSVIDSSFGAEGLTKLGIAGAVPTDATVLETLAPIIAKQLRDEKVKLPKPKRAGVKLDRGALADELESHVPSLLKAQKDVAREAREAEATLRTKRGAMQAYDGAFTQGARLLEAAAIIAGLADLAAKIRPSGRRPGETAGPDDTAPADPGASPKAA
jgi:hypothetical protein